MATRAESERSGIRVVRRGEPDYPGAALALADPPQALYVRGRWPLAARTVAIVGSRAASPYGLEMAARLGAGLAKLGILVVSGLAHGIDAAAHRAALEAGGSTMAILPGAHDGIVPRGHEALADAIARRGTVLSEHAHGPPSHAGAFLERNRLIAAFAQAVVVVEAKERSGALNTASHARRLGRPLLAVPGDVDRPTSRGCHALLRTGALICEGLSDLMEALEAPRAPGSARLAKPRPPRHTGPGVAAARLPGQDLAPAPSEPPAPSTPSLRLLAAIEAAPCTAETCARASGLTLEQTQAGLLELEWAGLAQAGPGGRWRRRGAGR